MNKLQEFRKQTEEAKFEAFSLMCKKVADLESQIEKLIDFVLSKTECCDVCPITDTCINSEGTCPYAGILAKGFSVKLFNGKFAIYRHNLLITVCRDELEDVFQIKRNV